MIRVNERADDDTWLGWFANRTILTPSNDLRVSELKSDLNREIRSSERQVAKLECEEKAAIAKFKAAYKKAGSEGFRETAIRADIVAATRARKDRCLENVKSYHRFLQEVDDIYQQLKQTNSMKDISGNLERINKQMNLLRTRNITQSYDIQREVLQEKTEMIHEALEDTDGESAFKEETSARLISSLADELNLTMESAPRIAPSESSSSKSHGGVNKSRAAVCESASGGGNYPAGYSSGGGNGVSHPFVTKREKTITQEEDERRRDDYLASRIEELGKDRAPHDNSEK